MDFGLAKPKWIASALKEENPMLEQKRLKFI